MTDSVTHPRQCDMSECHFRTIEMEEVHEFNRSTFTQCPVIDSTGLVVHFDVDGEHLSMFYQQDQICQSLSLSQMGYMRLRKYISPSEDSEPVAVLSGSLKLKNFFIKSSASWST
jgi:hypothetical protein